jgi:hypothetical protein
MERRHGETIDSRIRRAFGNSDGDRQMLESTAAGGGARFAGLVHHTDAVREWAYDRQSHIGRLDKALDEAGLEGHLWRRKSPRKPMTAKS